MNEEKNECGGAPGENSPALGRRAPDGSLTEKQWVQALGTALAAAVVVAGLAAVLLGGA